MDIKLAALDLDGTLYNDRKEITPHTMSVLEKASAHGIEIIPSTGRPFFGTPGNIRSLGFVNYILTCNGAAVYNRRSEECLFEYTMPCKLSAELLTELDKLHICIDVFISGIPYHQSDNLPIIDEISINSTMKEYIRTSRTFVDNIAQMVENESLGVQKITLNFVRRGESLIDREKTYDLLCRFSEIDVVSGGDRNYEITMKGVNKGSALMRLGKMLGAEPAEIMAIGDSENDLSMIQSAGLGVAMANSDECLLRAAKFITLSNEEDGVAYALERYALGIEKPVIFP